MNVKQTLCSILLACLMVQTSLQAQQKNKLIDRDFWRSQPTLKEVKQAVKEGHSPTAMTSSMFDATGYAILEKAPLKVIKYLMSQGNDVNKLTHDARTYIFWAAYKGNLELMEHLKAEGARMDLVDQAGNSILMFAAATGQRDLRVYEFCKQNGFDLATHTHRDGRNALLAFASRIEDFEMVDYFVKEGIDIHSTDAKGNGMFHYATYSGKVEVLKRLVSDYGVSYAPNKKTNENAFHFASRIRLNEDSPSPLALYSYLEGLGLDPTAVTIDGTNVLHNLVYRTNDLDLLNYFIDKGVYVNQVNEEKNTPLLNAASRGTKEEIALFVSHTNDINHQNKEGLSALTRALRYNDLDIVKMLVKKGANVKVKDAKGYDLGFHLADATRSNLEAFKEKMAYLQKKGYRPSQPQANGSTLLHAVVDKKNMDLIKLLIDMDIDINAKDSNGQTILHHAAMQAENAELLKFLLQAGADKSVLTEFEESAYDLAMENELLTSSNIDINFLKPIGQ